MFGCAGSKQCQSCGMPPSKDPHHGGSKKDGSLSTMYCSLCYKDGEFTARDCTVTQMQDIVDYAMKREGHNRLMRRLARRQIPHLARRKKKEV